MSSGKIETKYVPKFQSWANDGKTYDEMVNLFAKATGIKTSETAVRRFFKANGLVKPTNVSDPTTVSRAVRALANEQTAEDRLQDERDHLKSQLKQAEVALKRYREQESFEQRLEDHITYAVENNPYTQPLSRPKETTGKAKAKAHEFLLCVSDAHYGEVVKPEEALGLKYDTEIATRRIQHVRDTTFRYLELRESVYPVNKITIAVLGDMLSGIIHEELEVTNEIVMVDQATEVAHLLYNLFSDAAARFDEVEMVIMPGNHPRLFKKPRHKQKFNNFEFLMGKMVQSIVNAVNPDNDKLKVIVPRDLIYVHPIFDYRIGMTHGDGVMSNSFAGIPFYGMRNRREAIQALMSQMGQKRLDMLLMGHFHQYVDWKGECDIVINPSIKGGDEFGMSTRYQAPEAMQLLMEWHPEHGRTATNYINLDQIR